MHCRVELGQQLGCLQAHQAFIAHHPSDQHAVLLLHPGLNVALVRVLAGEFDLLLRRIAPLLHQGVHEGGIVIRNDPAKGESQLLLQPLDGSQHLGPISCGHRHALALARSNVGGHQGPDGPPLQADAALGHQVDLSQPGGLWSSQPLNVRT